MLSCRSRLRGICLPRSIMPVSVCHAADMLRSRDLQERGSRGPSAREGQGDAGSCSRELTHRARKGREDQSSAPPPPEDRFPFDFVAGCPPAFHRRSLRRLVVRSRQTTPPIIGQSRGPREGSMGSLEGSLERDVERDVERGSVERGSVERVDPTAPPAPARLWRPGPKGRVPARAGPGRREGRSRGPPLPQGPS
jgi:hypothetical protein